MLLGREVNYYTLFRWQNRNDDMFDSVVLECLGNVGELKTWEIGTDNIEFWVMPPEAENPTCLYLFPYDNGIVYFGG